jgi:hypothetical protein
MLAVLLEIQLGTDTVMFFEFGILCQKPRLGFHVAHGSLKKMETHG